MSLETVPDNDASRTPDRIDAGGRHSRPDARSDLNSKSLHGEVLTRLRDFIVEGNLSAGARIPERDLCERFGISRTPLREALKVLASEGLVDLLPNRGARVRHLGERELADLFDVMGGLESLAGRLACERMTTEDYEVIEKLHHEMYSFFIRKDLHGYFAKNQAIHENIVAITKNDALISTYTTYAGRVRRARYSANLDEDRDRWGEAMREHEEILDALRRRDGAGLSDILFRHLRNKHRAAVSQEITDQ
ncbi:GntR family transcriptional regulator [Methylobacterium sp. C25]|uniref:GntR family transcriptional regulator n=1 Tax=Methylobacterium sp. C25 TaxID=2721622 RepID=UPI001F381162|nr:GntR family transcriptional regulator [Methylobacterium sp. C25]MCE4224070.1 GntR family transcriptional regulator [Methylobacterium sp. C25]